MTKHWFFNGDCLVEMNKVEIGTVRLIICDLPFGCSENYWDEPIPFEPMWEHIYRVTYPNAAIVLMGVQPLVTSNINDFRYELVWKTQEKRNFLKANKMPLRQHINFGVWYRSLPKYFPQKTYGHKPVNSYTKHNSDGSNYGKTKINTSGGGQTDRFPTTVIEIPYAPITDRIHPTEKPVELYEWLIKTYSEEGDTVPDFTSGAGTAARAAWN